MATDAPVGCCGMQGVVKKWNIPSLFITAENDMMKSGMYRFADIAGGENTLVTFKDSALDLSVPTTAATSTWWPFLGLSFMGIPHHFALNTEEKDISHEPVTQFLKKYFVGGKEMQDSDKMVDGRLNSRAPITCCSPVCLFH